MTASIDQVKAQIAAAIDKAQESAGILQYGGGVAGDAQAMLVRATEGSGQADASEACGMLAQAVEGITDQQRTVHAAIQSAQAVLTRL